MLDTSAGSKPLIAARTSPASSTARQIGPILSRDQQRDIAPARDTRPNVGRKPTVPQRAHGATMEPNVSVPIVKAARPAAVAAAEPALDPRDPSSVFQGLRVWPPYQMSPKARAPTLVLPSRTPPAAVSRRITSASVSGILFANGSAPHPVMIPAVSRMSLAAYGMPCRGPSQVPSASSLSALSACASASASVTVAKLSKAESYR